MKFIVYQISSINPNLTKKYIGITQSFITRVALHKTDYNNLNSIRYHSPMYDYIRKHGGWIHFNFSILEEVDCEETEKHFYERKHFDLAGGFAGGLLLNKNIPNNTQKESSRNNYMKNIEKRRAYYQENKLRFKEYYKNHKEIYKQTYLNRKWKKLELEIEKYVF